MLEEMYNEFVALLGEENVIKNEKYITLAETTNYETHETIALVIKPGSSKELAACVKLAAQYKQPIYTVSKGKNWGYGSRVPVKDKSLLVELERMNAITNFDEQLGYITVEPGVTFNQAFDFLREKQSELIISIIGGSGEASLVGNTMERGIGTGLYADRFAHVCGLEVVLPNGDIIATGFEKYGDYETGKIFRWGEGPFLDGLFSQSNLGIITKMTVWLMKMPEQLNLAFYKITGKEILQQVIDTLQKMAFDGLIRPGITIYNDHRILSSLMQFPFTITNPGEIDPDELMKQIRKASPIGTMVADWNGEINIRSVSEEHAELQCRLISERLAGVVDELSFVTISRQEALQIFQEHYNTKEKNLLQPTLKTFLTKKYLGIPDTSAVRQAYWRKRTPVPGGDLDPDRDRCGILWICPVVPFKGKDANEAISVIASVAKKYSFEYSVSLQCTTERCINVIASISWDRDIESEEKAAAICYEEAILLLNEKGYFTYRGNTMQMHKKQLSLPYNNFLSALKKAIDPDQILSPGKYISED